MATGDDLVRVVRTADGSLALGRSLPGRGAWLCRRSPGCLEAAGRRKAFSRALRAPVEPEAVATLRVALAERARMDDGGDCRTRED